MHKVNLVRWLRFLLFSSLALVASSEEDIEALLQTNTTVNHYTSGCLQNKLPGWTKKRVCNSDDPPDAVESGLCREPEIPQLEIRIFCFNWDSTYFEAWLLQIILSELLDVPVTIESGNHDVLVSMYDPKGRFEFGITSDPITTSAFRNADKYGQDCSLASRLNTSYEPCAHHFPEIWNVDQGWIKTGVHEKILEFPYSLGMVALEGLYITKTTAQQEPSVLSYFGMMGDENRRKLAELFPRPFTWWDYCSKVSTTRCIVPDEVAQRPPMYEEERGKFYAEGLYTGHFQHTEENDCDLHPHNCTGHMAPFPCGWSSYAEAQMYHLDIAIRGGGKDPNMANRGYHYHQLEELTLAAKATGSNLLIEWWTPTQLSELLRGTDAELIKVAFPAPTQECLRKRHSLDDICAPDLATRVGDPISVCDEAPTAMRQSITTGLYHHSKLQNEAVRSPAYDVLKQFLVTEFELGEIFQNLKKANSTPRDATCQWVVDNMDSFVMPLVPRSHPRKLEETREPIWTGFALGFGVLSVLVILISGVRTYQHRERKVIRFAQIEFLWILLFGGLTLATGAIVVALPPTDATCIASVWLVNIGYTVILVPLIVKVAAINQLSQMSKKMMRVTLKRSHLLGVTALCCTSILFYLSVWTALDAPSKTAEYVLTESTKGAASYDNYTNLSLSEENYKQLTTSTVVSMSYYCTSESDSWRYITLGWNALLLVCCTVLAVQTRKVRQDFRESTVLGLLIYTHSIMALLVLMTYFLAAVTKASTMAKFRSILYSLDTLTTIIIYFVPKLLAELSFFKRSLGIRRINESMFLCSHLTYAQSNLERFSQNLEPLPFGKLPSSVVSDNDQSSNSHTLPGRVAPNVRRSIATSELMGMSIPENSALSTSEDFRVKEGDKDSRRRQEDASKKFSCPEESPEKRGSWKAMEEGNLVLSTELLIACPEEIMEEEASKEEGKLVLSREFLIACPEESMAEKASEDKGNLVLSKEFLIACPEESMAERAKEDGDLIQRVVASSEVPNELTSLNDNMSWETEEDRELIERLASVPGVAKEYRDRLFQLLSDMGDLRKENATLKQGEKARDELFQLLTDVEQLRKENVALKQGKSE